MLNFLVLKLEQLNHALVKLLPNKTKTQQQQKHKYFKNGFSEKEKKSGSSQKSFFSFSFLSVCIRNNKL